MPAVRKFFVHRVCAVACAAFALSACANNPPEQPVNIADALMTQIPAPEPYIQFTVRDTIPADALPAHPWIPPLQPDLLERVRDGFAIDAVTQKSIDSQLSWYVKHPDYVARVFKRSEKFLYYITEELEKRDMPTEIALLPVVESAFDPFAYSHGRAAGLWQIIPGTGRRFGVKQNWWYDGRRDVVDSTRAALDYLQMLHKQFDGDWLLAIAAYNSGEGNVHKAIKRNRKAGKATDFWHLNLPRETRAYVPKLLAVKRMFDDPERYALEIETIPNTPYFEIINSGGQIDLALAANLAGISMDALYSLNPGFNQWATDPDGPHRLLVQVEHAEALDVALATLPDRDRMRWVRYKIKNGESLIAIAKKHNTTPGVLKRANGIRGSLIRAGDYLMIPTATQGMSEYTLSADARRRGIQNRTRGGKRVAHHVRPGDTLWDISQRYDVGTRQLASWNAMAPGDTLTVGRELVIWTDVATAYAPSISGGPGGKIGSNRTRRINYTVRKGDSLYRISSRFKVSIAQLRRWNNLSGKKYLQPGQKIVMYVDVTQQSGG